MQWIILHITPSNLLMYSFLIRPNALYNYEHHMCSSTTQYDIYIIGYIRVESGSHLLTHLTHWPTEQSGCDPHVVKVINATCHEKFSIWNNAIHFFILGRIQNQSHPQTSWRWNLYTPHASKQLEIKISWFQTNDILVHSSDPKFTHSPVANIIF